MRNPFERNADEQRPARGMRQRGELAPADEAEQRGRERRARTSQAGRPARGSRGTQAPDQQGRGRGHKPRRPKKPSRLGMLVGNWWNRLISAVYSGSLSSQTEQYTAHNTTQDYIWNSVGLGAWGVVFPVLSVVTTQLIGVEPAGRFSMAFVTGTLLLFIANYGVRTFQVSDLAEKHSFSDYQANRVVTCVVMLVVGILYCQLRGYDPQMFTLCMGMFVYRAIDGLADVYEGRLQQMDKLYLAGISQAIRSAAVIVAYSVVILITRSLGAAGIAMAVAAAASFVLLTLPLTFFETPKSKKLSLGSVKDLFVQCFPLFVALFLYNLIDNMPKFAMEGVLSYDNQLYFNALFSPAHIIIMVIGFIYKPQLMRLAEIWADPKRRGRFDIIVLAVLAIIVALALGVAGFMGTVGIPIMSFLYGVDFEQFRGLCYVMVATGGVCAAIDFLYQIITVLRRQKAVTRVYLLTLGFSLFVPPLLIGFTGLPGAVLGYLIVMCILLVLLVTEYLSIHAELSETLKSYRKPARTDRPSATPSPSPED
ncbi:oligosaccharide flippase family protein [uncultured Parolsenella sp.]|uniref:lipopolysaccharide biosynthesis protein n=1 Tax=uncultured Parolsenella sp. TaxID=2083008 RepID=UPI0025E8C6FC|nr:oligosaccharide flippase family protein [uncultured Parolsenella sp.]